MTKERVNEVLSEQLELLSEYSKKCSSSSDLCALTSAMAETLRLIDEQIGFSK